MDEEIEKILNHLSEEISNRIEIPLSDSRRLYHYTSFDSAINIIKSAHFWFFDLFNQPKDPDELMHGIKISTELIKEFIPKQRLEGGKIFLEKLFPDSFVKGEYKKVAYFYVGCFSKLSDDPHQWNSFADKNNGICLQFSPLLESDFRKTDFEGQVLEVNYDHHLLKILFKEILEIVCERIDAGLNILKIKESNPKEAIHFMKESSIHTAIYLLNLSLNYKPLVFARENEIRFLQGFQSTNKPEVKSINGKEYRDWAFTKKSLEAVWLGPNNTNVDEIRKDLDQNGFKHTEIIKSQSL